MNNQNEAEDWSFIPLLAKQLKPDLPSVRQYKDVSGNPCSLEWLVRNEPEWAANQIRHRDHLEEQHKNLRNELEAAQANIADLAELIRLAHEWGANRTRGYDAGKAIAFEYAARNLLSNAKLAGETRP